MKCLVTKLQGVIKDDNLLKLGEIRFKLNEGTVQSLAYATTKGTTLNLISGDATMVNTTTGETLSFPIRINTDLFRYKLIVGKGGATISISDKYEFSTLGNLFSLVVPTNVADVSYLTNATNFNGGSSATSGLVGDVADIKGCPNVVEFFWKNPLCVGNIAELSKFNRLASVNIKGGSLSGTIESLVEKYRESGRTTGTINFLDGIPSGVTYQGATIDNGTKVLTWTASTISLS